MKSGLTRLVCVLGAIVGIVVEGSAQQDPRVGLKPGIRDAGQAARHLELVASVPKPEGFYDPAKPAGEPTGPETPTPPAGTPNTPLPADQVVTGPTSPTRTPVSLSFANSDLAFSGSLVFIGNFNGFNTYDIETPKKPQLFTSIVCPGGQGDLSVYGHLLFMSVEETRGRIDCGTQGVSDKISADRFRGVRIFDISDVRKPKQIAAIQTCRGSHTHTLLVDPKDKANVYIYVSGTSSVRAGEELTGCSSVKEDPETSLFSIDVIQVPLASPERARIVSHPRIFSDPRTGAIAGLWPGGDHGPGTQRTSLTDRCHDVTVFPEIGLAAGACSGNGILLDISDPVHPVRLDEVADPNFAFWHSATFNNDGTKVIFTDEWGGGTRPRCRATDQMNWGADAIFDIVDRKLQFAGYYKMPAAQTDTENCVAHNGALIPVPGRDIMAQAWYQGGVSVFDFTDSAHPIEIAFFDRGPLDATKLITGGFWSTYWYNGNIYGTEIARGLDIFKLTPSEFLTQNEIDAASQVHSTEFNAQHQQRIKWPATTVVAKAYLDQLGRTHGITSTKATAVKSAIEKADRIHSKSDKGAATAAEGLLATAAELQSDAASATGADASRLRALAETLKGRAEAIH